MNDFPSMANDFLAPHVKLLTDSYEHFTGQKLIDANSAAQPPARAIFEADFVVLSKNLLTVDYREIPSAEVEMTFVGGELKYQK